MEPYGRTKLGKALERTRRRLSRRLATAIKEGRLHAEWTALWREGQEAWVRIMNGGRKPLARRAL